MELRQRKKNRLQGYDYKKAGCYFITICVADRAEMLGKCRGAHCAPAHVTLSDVGYAVENAILQIPDHHKGVYVDKYVIMPNHIHMILILEPNGGRTMCAPTEALVCSGDYSRYEGSRHEVHRFFHLAEELP